MKLSILTFSLRSNIQGWAIEARIYAEDPIRGFLPSTGPLLHYEEPPQQLANHDISGYTVRIDSGVTEGSEISVHYDPMISKLITHADSRNEAIDGKHSLIVLLLLPYY